MDSSKEYKEKVVMNGITNFVELAKAIGVSEAFVDELLWDLISESGKQAQHETFVDNYEPVPPDTPNLD